MEMDTEQFRYVCTGIWKVRYNILQFLDTSPVQKLYYYRYSIPFGLHPPRQPLFLFCLKYT